MDKDGLGHAVLRGKAAVKCIERHKRRLLCVFLPPFAVLRPSVSSNYGLGRDEQKFVSYFLKASYHKTPDIGKRT